MTGTKKMVVIGLVALVAAVAIVFVIRKRPPPATPPDQTESTAAAPTNPPQTVAVAVPVARQKPAPPSQLARTLIDDLRACLSQTSDDDRHRDFLNLLAAMRPQDTRTFMDVLAEFRRKGMSLAFERGAFWRRRAQLDPNQALIDLQDWTKNVQQGGAVTSGPNVIEGRDLAESFAQFFQSWAASDSAAARAWLGAHAGDPYYAAAFSGFLEGYAASDPAGATSFVLSSLPPDDPRVGAMARQICAKLLQSGDPLAAAKWFEQLPTDQTGTRMRQSVVRDIANGLMDQDLAGARSWIGAQADKPWRDPQAIEAVAGKSALQDPAGTMAWISSLTPDPHNGAISGVGAVVRRWFASDPDGLEQWLQANQAAGSRTFAQAAGECAVMSAPTDYNKALAWLNQIPDTFPIVRQYFQHQVQAYAPKTPPAPP